MLDRVAERMELDAQPPSNRNSAGSIMATIWVISPNALIITTACISPKVRS